MSINLDKLSNELEYNILLIGKSYTGKSTFINAFANYLKFKSLDEAMVGKLEEVIPTTFQMKDLNTEEWIEIVSGGNKNEFDNGGGYTRTERARIYEFRCDEKVIRFIDTPGIVWKPKYEIENDYLSIIFECLSQFQTLHQIVLVTRGDSLSLGKINLLQTFHKSLCNNFVICKTKDLIYPTIDPTTSVLKCHIDQYTKLTPRPCENLLTIDNCAYELLVAHKQGHIFSEERTDECRTSWIKASKQIQTMLTKRKPCQVTKSLVLMAQAIQIKNLCFDLLTTDTNQTAKSVEINRISNLIKQNPTEYRRIEDICVQLWIMVICNSLISFEALKDIIHKYKSYYTDKQRFFEKMQKVLQNRHFFDESFEAKQLFTELCNLKYSGSYFTNQLNQIKQSSLQFSIPRITISILHGNDFLKYRTHVPKLIQLQQILSIVTENNLLLVDIISNKKCVDLRNATLHNVVFTCGNSSTSIGDIVLDQSNLLNINREDIEFILENIDHLIKSNFENLIPVIRNYSPMKVVIENETQNRTNTDILAQSSYSANGPIQSTSRSTLESSTFTLECDMNSQYRPYLKYLNQHSSHPDVELIDDLDKMMEHILKLKHKIIYKK